MKLTIIISLLVAIMSIGCSHTSFVRIDSAEFIELQQKVKNKNVKLNLKNNQVYKRTKLTRLAPDSTSWIQPNGQVVSVSTATISQICFVNRGRGALQGLGIGVLAGAGLAVTGTEERAWLGFAIIFTGALGGIIGLPIGIAAGSKHIYKITDSIFPSAYQKTIVNPNDKFAIWKQSLRSLLNTDEQVFKIWKEYARFYYLDIDPNIWVSSLRESDYQDFISSAKQLREWLIIKFSARQPVPKY